MTASFATPDAPCGDGRARVGVIDLAELRRIGDLQVRVDRKYVLAPAVAHEVLESACEELRMLEIGGRRSFSYHSVYFDTADLASFRGAAYGRRRRFKVRTRSYVDSGNCMLEVKRLGYRGRTDKQRMDYPITNRDVITSAAERFIASALDDDLAGELLPTLTTTYRRRTFLDSAATARVTWDEAVSFEDRDGGSSSLGNRVVIEVKSPGPLTTVDRLLWARGHRPVRLSKYCVGLISLRAGLPANRWNPTLRRQLGWVPSLSR